MKEERESQRLGANNRGTRVVMRRVGIARWSTPLFLLLLLPFLFPRSSSSTRTSDR